MPVAPNGTPKLTRLGRPSVPRRSRLYRYCFAMVSLCTRRPPYREPYNAHVRRRYQRR